MPYGMMGGLGGSGYQSPGASVLSGMEAGANFIWQAQDRLQRAQDIQYEHDRQNRLDAMRQSEFDMQQQAMQDKQQQAHAEMALQAVHSQQDELSKNMVADTANWGGDGVSASSIADPIQQQAWVKKWAPQVGDINQQLQGIRQAAFAPYMRDQQKWAAEYGNKTLNSGNLDLSQPGAAQDFNRYVGLTTHLDPHLFLREADGTSEVGRAIDDVTYAIKNPNEPDAKSRYASGWQTLAGPQANTGLGQTTAGGAIKTGQAIDQDKPVVPTADGQAAHPVVTVNAMDPNTGEEHVHGAQPMLQDGFLHPDNQGLVAVTPDKQADTLQRLKALELAANANPQVRKALADAAQTQDPALWNYQAMVGYLGVPKRDDQDQTVFKELADPANPGKNVVKMFTYNRQGVLVREPVPVGAPATKRTALQEELDDINTNVSAGLYTPEQGKAMTAVAISKGWKNAAYGLSGGAAPAGGAGGKVKEASEAEIKAAQAAAVEEAEVQAGIGHRKVTSTDADGNQVIQDQPYHKSTGIALTGDEQVEQDRANLAAKKSVVEQARPAGIAPHAAGAGAKPAPKLGAPPAAPAAGQPPPPAGYKPL
jgi:hypothetical protein